jgi:hypothetical protein
VVQSADFSAKLPRFQLARYAICDDFEHFFTLLPDLIKNADLTLDNLREWPLFRSVRKQPQFDGYVMRPPSGSTDRE